MGPGVQPLRSVLEGRARPKVAELMPYYKDLVDEFLPEPLKW